MYRLAVKIYALVTDADGLVKPQDIEPDVAATLVETFQTALEEKAITSVKGTTVVSVATETKVVRKTEAFACPMSVYKPFFTDEEPFLEALKMAAEAAFPGLCAGKYKNALVLFPRKQM